MNTCNVYLLQWATFKTSKNRSWIVDQEKQETLKQQWPELELFFSFAQGDIDTISTIVWERHFIYLIISTFFSFSRCIAIYVINLKKNLVHTVVFFSHQTATWSSCLPADTVRRLGWTVNYIQSEPFLSGSEIKRSPIILMLTFSLFVWFWKSGRFYVWIKKGKESKSSTGNNRCNCIWFLNVSLSLKTVLLYK